MSPVSSVGAAVLLFGRSVRSARGGGVPWREVLRQTVELGSASAPLVLAGLSFFGAVMVTIAQAQARKYTGNVTVVGAAYFELIVREFAPMLVALLAASRAGAAISAELGSMAVNEQLEAMALSSGDPLRELVLPRLLGSLVSVPLLAVLGTVAAALAADFTVSFVFGADGATFIDPRFVDRYDLLCAGLKAFLCGAFIPLVAAHHGLRASGGAQAVGQAVTQGVIDACTGCLLLDFLIAAAFLVLGV